MTMIDEEVLRAALRQTADTFEVSSEATHHILSAAMENAPPHGVIHAPAFLREPGRARSLLVAAVLVLIVGAISVPLFRTEHVVKSARLTAEGLAVIPYRDAQSLASRSGAVTTNTKVLKGTGTGLQVTVAAAQAVAAHLSPKIESSGTVDVTVQSGHVESTFSRLSAMVIKDGGFVNGTQAHVGTRGTGHFSYGTIVLQVPQHVFTTLVSQVQRVGHVTSINTTSTDVTAQYVDLRARISAFEVSRSQYLTIMSRAKSIGDVLAVQNQLNNLQSQIEQLQGQLNVLNNATTFATLSVGVSETGHSTSVTHHRSGLSKAFHDSVSGFVAGVEWLIRLAGPVLFALLMLGALSTLGRVAWRAVRRRRI